jgi:hypothetical protein
MKDNNIEQYMSVHRACDSLLIIMLDSPLSAAKAPDENFLQNVHNEIATQADRYYQYKMEMRKPKMLTEEIETQQRLMEKQVINQKQKEKKHYDFKRRIFSSNNPKLE